MRVLLTNIALETRGGSELYLLDVAGWLHDHGHTPVAYSARLGSFADTIREHAIPVIDDLARLAEPPDLIHAHHHLPAMAALARYPLTPAVYLCHGWLPWDEAPLRHPAIRRYVAVSHATRERLVAEHAVPASRVRVLPNFVDTRRFRPREPMPERPRRALVFSNQATEGGWVETLRGACAARGIEVDLAGWRSGQPLDWPEEVLGRYDLVFARGRSALEAMAVGCAVVLCDAEGLGPMVTPESFDRLGAGNFGMQVLRDPHRPELFLRAIDAYDTASAAGVSALVRQTRTLEHVAPQVSALYHEAMSDVASAPHSADQAHAAAADYVGWLHREFPVPRQTQRQAYARTLVEAEARVRDLAAELEHRQAIAVTGQAAVAEAERDTAAAHAERDATLAEGAAALAAVQAERDAARAESAAARAAARAERDAALAQGAAALAAADAERNLALSAAHAERDAALAQGAAGRAAADDERIALVIAHQAAMDGAAHKAGQQQQEIERLTAEAGALREELARIQQGFLFRRVLPLLWRARLGLLPNGTRRHRVYVRAKGAVGRLVVPAPGPPPTSAGTDPAEVATAMSPDLSLAAVVLDLGDQPETVGAVASLLAQVPRPEVVVVSTGGGAVDRRLAQAGLDVPVVQISRALLPGAARNVGLAATVAPYVGFLASDCLAQPGWVAGRLAAHAAGARAVSSAVVNHARWNPFAAAAHCLLFGPRLPGTPRAGRLHYGASYARDLFARFGTFRNDLRTGEDTEMRERFAGQVPFVFRSDVRAAHRNPTSLVGLLRDQFRRGRRTVRAREALYAGPAGALVARTSLTRVPRSLWTTLVATPMLEWGPVLWGMPWLAPAALAYSMGAATSGRPRGARSSNGQRTRSAFSVTAASRGTTRLICVVPFRNERRYLPGFLTNVAEQVDGILALDDGSTDGSGEIAAAHPAVLEVVRIPPQEPHRWNELRNRRLLVDAAGRHGAEWVLALDADERVERGFRERAEMLIQQARPDDPGAFAVTIRELWDEPDLYRCDGIWSQKHSARLFRLRADHDFGSRALHGHWAPENSRGPDGLFSRADAIVYHLRMIDPADRERRMRRYLTLDPERRWQAIGYEYLVDTNGLSLEPLPAGREYEPLAAPPALPHANLMALASNP